MGLIILSAVPMVIFLVGGSVLVIASKITPAFKKSLESLIKAADSKG